MQQIPVNDIFEDDDSRGPQRFFRMHIQTWFYVACSAGVGVSLLGITFGILASIFVEWHERTLLYKQHLAYLRRADPSEYWLFYKISTISWTVGHFMHIIVIVVSVVGNQKTRPRLMLPHLAFLTLQTSFFIAAVVALFVLSFTRTRHIFFSIIFTLFFTFAAVAQLVIVVKAFRHIDDKARALREILANTKSVHFKENRGVQ